MVKNVRRVAVIGAGPAGAITTDALAKEQTFDTIRVFERKGIAGGTWVYTPDLLPGIPSLRALIKHQADLPIPIPPEFPSETHQTESINSHQLRYSDTGIHENLHSNLPPSTMSFTQEPIPEVISKRTSKLYGPNAPFRHREVVREWIEGVFTRGGHQSLIEFNTTVELAVKNGDEWVLTLRKVIPGTNNNYWWQEIFDAVIVASGHFSLPYIPNIPGLIEYDEKYPGRIKHSKHFRSVDEFKGKKVVVVGGSVSAFDALHEIRVVSQHPVVASLREPLPLFEWAPFTHPHITVRSPIARFHPNSGTIDFEDRSSIDNVDIILFATGYDFSFPFLPSVKIENRRIRGLYKQVIAIDDPTLGFVGMVAGGLTFRVFEWQAVAIARLLAGRATLPSHKEMKEWEHDRLSKRGDGIPFFTIATEFEEYFEDLKALAGEPATGTTGRVLPKFDLEWTKEFLEVVSARTEWWDKERRKAEEEMNRQIEVKL